MGHKEDGQNLRMIGVLFTILGSAMAIRAQVDQIQFLLGHASVQTAENILAVNSAFKTLSTTGSASTPNG